MGIVQKLPSKNSHVMKIASYLLIFAVLSNIIYIPCYFYIRKINRANVTEHYQYRLNSGMQLLDSSIHSFLALGILIAQDTDYNEIHYVAPVSDQTLKDLRSLTSLYLTIPYSFITNFGLTENDRILFTRNEIYFNRDLLTYDHYFQCEDESYFDHFKDTYCLLPACRFSTATAGRYTAVTMGYCCSAINHRYLFVHYPVDALMSLFVDETALDSNYAALYYNDVLLASSGTPAQGNGQLLTVSSNTGLGLRVELYLRDRYIEQDLSEFRHLVQIFLGIILFATGLWIVIFSRRITKPFNQISRVLSDYSQIIDEQKERNRIHILERAIYKGIYDEMSRNTFAEAFPDFPKQWQLALIQYTSDKELVKSDSAQLLVTQYFQQQMPEMILLPYSQEALLAFSPMCQKNCAQLDLKESQTYLQNQYMISITYTVTPVYDDYTLLFEAFQQLEYESITSQQFASPSSRREDLPISIQQVQTIYLALENGDAKSAASVLQNVSFTFLNPAQKDFSIAKCTYHMIAYALIRIKLEHNALLDIPIPNFRRDHLEQLFREELPCCFTQIASRLEQQQANAIQNLDANILAFIDENIGNQQLCISMVTDNFHISAPTLQKRMNACIGKTFSAYVEDIRLKKACQLLHDTEASVQQIAEAVGYTNANSFYKAYKRCYGVSPRLARQNKNL